ncbi:MAG: GFA family protein [Rudaea sp.]|uniref:GFA family protein n=1 Tax=Rudaea sp. TaxID=2136325 RepID=UPI0039E56B6B
MKYQGSCHCGQVAYEVDGEFAGVMSCNCSICTRAGYLLWFVPRENLHVLRGDRALANYTFNKHVIQHKFCPACGIHPFAEGVDPSGKAMAAINVRCLENIDLDALNVTHFDGRSR